MKEPLTYFLEKKPFNRAMIKEWVVGEKYVALMLANGNIGICATLGTQVSESLFSGVAPDLKNPSDRIIVNAWLNAMYNYETSVDGADDIFDALDFSRPGKTVMVGFFESLYEKFRKSGIPVTVFDLAKKSPVLTPTEEMVSTLADADTVILTGTTIFNNTFRRVTGMTGADTSVYLLGPSNILSRDMFGYRNISVVFGSKFEPYDHNLLKKISQGHGTRGFLPNLKKVYLVKENPRDAI